MRLTLPASMLGILFLSPLLWAPPSPAHAVDLGQIQACLRACPQGDAESVVYVEDAFGQPMAGVFVILDLPYGAEPFEPCLPVPSPVEAMTDQNGEAIFYLSIAGLAQGGVNVLIDDGNGPVPVLNNQPLRGFDMDGSRRVDMQDHQMLQSMVGNPNPELDFNCNGTVDPQDVNEHQLHLGHRCDSQLAAGFGLEGIDLQYAATDDSVAGSADFQGGTPGNAVGAMDVALSFTADLNAGTVDISLDELNGRLGEVSTPLGNSGAIRFVFDSGATPTTGLWETDGSFNLGPFPVVIYADVLDSMREANEVLDQSLDATPTLTDTLLCTFSGMVMNTESDLEGMAILKAEPGQTTPLLGMNDFQMPMFIGNYDGRNRPARGAQPKRVKEYCKEVCIIPVILQDDNGGNAGLTLNQWYIQRDGARTLFEGACIAVNFRKPLVLKSTALNQFGGTNTNARSKERMIAAVKKNATFKEFYKGQLKSLKIDVDDCIVLVFTGGANIKHASGAYTGVNGSRILVNFAQASEACRTSATDPTPKFGNRLIAHELGHTLGIKNHTTGATETCMHDCASGGIFTGTQPAGSTAAITTGQAKFFFKNSKAPMLRATKRYVCYKEIKLSNGKNGCIKISKSWN